MRVLAAVGLVGLLSLAGAEVLRCQEKDKEAPKYNLIYVPTEVEVIEKMFDMAKVSKKDVVYDLGCGDGRIVALACKKFGCRGVGIDLNPERIKECMDTIKKYNVESFVESGKLQYRLGDALKVCDFDQATVVMLYMLPQFMDLLEPVAKQKLKPGTRIVSHDYRWADKDWEPDVTIESFKGPSRTHTLYMWTVKEKKQQKENR
jgi:cyclopropane fatty-acyl-phospholipid synthase-like methyltransferase